MLQSYHIVPWFSSNEWLKVYEKLFSENATYQSKHGALQYLLIWKARSPSLPAGVESTISLLEVDIQDCNNGSENNAQLLRMAYSTAIMRFVNHMLDEESAKVNSLYKAAKNCGLPDWIVDLRHETAHSNNLPSLDLLREATFISLEWLRINYWAKHKEVISDCSVNKTLIRNVKPSDKINALLNFCMSLSFSAHPKCRIKNIGNIPNDLRESLIADAYEVFGDKVDLSNLKKVYLTTLINHTISYAKKLLKNCESSEINSILLGNDSIFLSNELCELMTKSPNNKGLDSNYVKGFEFLLKFLSLNGYLVDFTMALVRITEDDINIAERKKLAALWIQEILKTLRKQQQFFERAVSSEIDLQDRNSKELLNLYFHWYPNDKRHLLLDLSQPVPQQFTNMKFLQPIISTYNPYLKYFIKDFLLLIRPELPSHIVDKICTLAELIGSPEKFPVESSKIYTVDDLQKKQNTDSIDIVHVESGECFVIDKTNSHLTAFGLWKKSSEVYNWSSCPIGLLPWQQMSQITMDFDR
ncbi:uncharacterized protein LOC126973082 [Leptidea sinapis]|uniref:Uncharacterized protein n=1 Tax=Leptidea sinapis TaxID=189913 RepID=A0A5E4PP72_9NEOP|nr:uncharacterized protein LOC126973082 [Leptidea sinapis]VVC86800.1 unnamed protein product [Leptidea sinapis]